MANRDYQGNWSRNFTTTSPNSAGGFGSFLTQIGSTLSPVLSAVNPILGMLGNMGLNAVGSYFTNQLQNAHLTGKEREQNAWNAEQAQINRDYQTEMSNTAYQRAVADMSSAGLNPALMYGNGSAASTPTGSNAQGSASLTSPMDVITMAMQMKYMEAQIRNLDSQTDKNAADAGLSRQNTENAKLTYDLTKKNIEGADWDNKTKEIAYDFAKRTFDTRVERESLTTEQTRKQNEELDSKIANLNQDLKNKLQEYVNLTQQYRNLVAQESLTYEQQRETAHMIGQIDALRDKLVKEGDLTQKDIDNYDFNHAKTTSVGAGSFKTDVVTMPDGTMVNARDMWKGSNKQRRQANRQ